jgi:hypothetical protein
VSPERGRGRPSASLRARPATAGVGGHSAEAVSPTSGRWYTTPSRTGSRAPTCACPPPSAIGGGAQRATPVPTPIALFYRRSVTCAGWRRVAAGVAAGAAPCAVSARA